MNYSIDFAGGERTHCVRCELSFDVHHLPSQKEGKNSMQMVKMADNLSKWMNAQTFCGWHTQTFTNWVQIFPLLPDRLGSSIIKLKRPYTIIMLFVVFCLIRVVLITIPGENWNMSWIVSELVCFVCISIHHRENVNEFSWCIQRALISVFEMSCMWTADKANTRVMFWIDRTRDFLYSTVQDLRYTGS